MRRSGLKIGRIPITAELLLYALLTISVISGLIVNTSLWATQSKSLLEIFIIGLVSLLGGIGFIAIILEVAKRWYIIGGVIFLAIGLFALFSIFFSYNEELGLLHDPPYMFALALLIYVSLTVSGIIVIIKGKPIFNM